MKPIKQSAPLNRSLHTARADQQDEFYTQYVDLQTNAESRSRTSSPRLAGRGRIGPKGEYDVNGGGFRVTAAEAGENVPLKVPPQKNPAPAPSAQKN